MRSGEADPSNGTERTSSPARPPVRRLGRNAAATSLGALGGVAAGLLLDVAIAASFGAGPATDSLFVAMRLPVGIAAVIMAGANQSLVPTFSRWHINKTSRDFSRSVSVIFGGTLVAGSLLAAIGMLLAHPLMALTAPGLSAAGIDQATALARVMFWLVPLVAAAEVLRGYMNARHRFGVPAAMGVVMNGLAAGIVIVASHRQVAVAAWAYVIGAAAQLLFMMVMATLAGLRLTPSLALRDPELAATARVSSRPLLAAALNPLARVVEQSMISFLPAGSITILNYSNRLISAIGGTVLFRSVMVVLLPRLTAAWEGSDLPAVRAITRSGITLMLQLSLPLTAVFVVFSRPGAVVVFNRGQFTRSDALLLGTTLSVYATSLVGQAVQRALLAPFYARLSMKIPLRNSIYGVVANLLLLPVLVLPARDNGTNALIGVAVAFSISQYVNVVHAWWHLRRMIGPVSDPAFNRSVIWSFVAMLVSGAVMLHASDVLGLDEVTPRWVLLGRTALAATLGLSAFALLMIPLSRHPAEREGAGRHSAPRDDAGTDDTPDPTNPPARVGDA